MGLGPSKTLKQFRSNFLRGMVYLETDQETIGKALLVRHSVIFQLPSLLF